jgi:hypothetical protein
MDMIKMSADSNSLNLVWTSFEKYPNLRLILIDFVMANGQREVEKWETHPIMECVVRSIFAHLYSREAQFELSRLIIEINNGRAPHLPLMVSDLETAIRGKSCFPVFVVMWKYVKPNADDVNRLFEIAATTNEDLALWIDRKFPDEIIKERHERYDIHGPNRIDDEKRFMDNINQMSDKMALVWFERRLHFFGELLSEAVDKIGSGALHTLRDGI